MKTNRVNELGAIGYVADREPHAIPPNAWSEMQNMRCVDKSIAAFEGHAQIDTISIHPQTINFVKSGPATYLVYAENDTIYSYTAGTEAQISSGHSQGGYWDSCVLGGVCILNNGVENPRYWGGEGNTVDLPYDTRDDAICTWADQGMTAKVIRPFRYHLFALDIDDCDGRNRRKAWWSHPADPGSLPVTWDPTLRDYNAGFVELSETPGAIIDGLALRDTFQIYKEDAIYAATFTGTFDELIFNFRLVTTSYGLYSRNCVADVGGRHFFVGDGDIYLYDGTNFTSIADERVKNLFFNGVSRTQFHKTYCTYYHRTGEVWLCYPSAQSADCDTALVWDSNGNTWSQREIPNANCAIFSIVDRASDYIWTDIGSGAYANQTGTLYDSWADWGTNPASPEWTTWSDPIDTSPIYDSLVMAGDQKLFEMDSGNTAAGVNMTCYARREALDLGDKADWHKVLELYPRAEGGAFNVRVGYQNTLNDTITWSSYQSFNPSTDYRLNFRVTGRLHAIEFQSNADVAWKVSGYDVDYEIAGRR
jgi:hypothetical protein